MSKRLLGELELNLIYQREAIEGMRLIPDKSIDMILCDLPYGTTQCKWDTVIPFEPLWEQYERIIKDSGAIVLTAAQPFTSALVMSNPKRFKYEWVWDKVKPTNMLNASHQPLRRHENVCVFYKKKPTYNPQKVLNPKGTETRGAYKYNRENEGGETVGRIKKGGTSANYEPDKLLPVTIQAFSKDAKPLHPTQKPVDLFAYLIRTYTNEGEIVLDNCMGSGTTAVAALRTNRQFIGFELEPEYVEIANKRIDNEGEAK